MKLSSIKEENLQSLALDRKGVAFVDHKSSPTPIPTIVISLGGLGAETLNTLKGKFTRDIGECDHIWFRMIDTDVVTLDEYCKVKADGTPNHSSDAHMESEETILLYDMALRNCLAPAFIPAYIDKWLNPALEKNEIWPDGARQMRQLGRVMAVHDSVYTRVRRKLCIFYDAIRAANGGPINIILIAGVSGGTGGGCVIDISYMIHDLMREFGYANYKLAGYLFTPDALFSIPVIANNPTALGKLRANGYAALKEIDYYMNLEKTDSFYKLELANNRTVKSKKNIFDSCTLLSGYNEAGDFHSVSDILSGLTEHLMDILTDIKVIKCGKSYQMSDYITNNSHEYIKQWFHYHPERRLYHRYATYKYQVIDFNLIKIPRDEVFAYCVNKTYEGVLRELKDFQNVNWKMLGKVYEAAHIRTSAEIANYAKELGRISRHFVPLDYSKKAVRDNPMLAYEDACEMAKSEAARIKDFFVTGLENDVYDSLKKQIDLIFDQYGPYVALRAIRHEESCLTEGEPNEPFSGAYEQLIRLSNVMTAKEKKCIKSGDAQVIQKKAEAAVRLLGNTSDMAEYVSECYSQAIERYLDPVFFHALSKALLNVAARIYDYSKQFSEYTAIMDEVRDILGKDGDYFSRGDYSGNERRYPVDLIKSRPERNERLHYYLDDFISQVSVQDIAQVFIKSMGVNKEKWLAQENEKNFDVAAEVRAIMDDCLVQNNLIPESIEKLVFAAFYPENLTEAQLDAIWLNDAPGGPKMQALNAAAHYILQTLEDGPGTMACAAGEIPLEFYGCEHFISAMKDMPTLREILDRLIFEKYQTHIAVSDSNRFTYTRQYFDIPLYILRGMAECNEQYVRNPAPGMHIDERGQDWSRVQNPYTIDAVALDLNNNGKHPGVIDTYPDRSILDEVEKQTRYGLKIGYVKVEQISAADARLTLFDITTQPSDMEQFKEELYKEAHEAYAKEREVDIITFMSTHGFELNQVLVSADDTDIDLGLIDFEEASTEDKETKYKNIPVPVEDVYKWLRKSIRYMDILEKDYVLFGKLEQVLKKAANDVERSNKYKRDIDTFALALKTGDVRRNESDQEIWVCMDRNDPVIVDMKSRNRFDRKFFLYHVFAEFQKKDEDILDEIKERAMNGFQKGNLADSKEIDYIKAHIKEMLGDDCLGDMFNLRGINESAEMESEAANYQSTDDIEYSGNPFVVLRSFYIRINAFME